MPGLWRQIEIAGKTADIYQPPELKADGAVMFLHGHGLVTLADNRVYSSLFDEYGLRVICPHGGPSWWLDQICTEFDPERTPEAWLLQDVVPWIDLNWQIRPPQIALFGVSMGGQGALRLAYRHALRFRIVAALAPLIDFHTVYGAGLPLDRIYASAEEARQETATLQIHPLNWPPHHFIGCDPTDEQAFDGVVRLLSKLHSSGIPTEEDLQTSHGGHRWEYFNHMAPRVVPWLAHALLTENLRFVE